MSDADTVITRQAQDLNGDDGVYAGTLLSDVDDEGLPVIRLIEWYTDRTDGEDIPLFMEVCRYLAKTPGWSPLLYDEDITWDNEHGLTVVLSYGGGPTEPGDGAFSPVIFIYNSAATHQGAYPIHVYTVEALRLALAKELGDA